MQVNLNIKGVTATKGTANIVWEGLDLEVEMSVQEAIELSKNNMNVVIELIKFANTLEEKQNEQA